jgi:TorA maturation chaperone TorD
MVPDWSEVLSGEMLVFGLLSKAFCEYPEKVWLQSLIGGDVFSESPFAGEDPDVIDALAELQEWSNENRAGLSVERFEAMRIDYTRLFIGPGTVLTPPWESVFFSKERLTFQESTLHVREWYRRFGLEMKKLHSEPDDHIGLELEFLAHLSKLGAAASQETGKPPGELLDAQRAFLTEHVMTWAPVWCGQVRGQAKTAFYRGIALFTRGVLRQAALALDVKESRGNEK